MPTNQAASCALCGGPVDQKGRTVAAAPPSRPGRVRTVASVAQLQGADPLAHLTPGERFTRALDRRDALVRDRRKNVVDRRNPVMADRRTNPA